MEQLAEGVRLLIRGDGAEAKAFYLRVWHEASLAGDDYTACAAAHLLGVMEPMPAAEKLTWHLASLACANRVQGKRVDDWYASIYVNLGQVYRLLDQPTETLAAYQEAYRRTYAISDPSYAEALRASIAQALTELKAPPDSSPRPLGEGEGEGVLSATEGVNSPSEPTLVPPRPPAPRSAP